MRRIAIGILASAVCGPASAVDDKAAPQVGGWETYAVVSPADDAAAARPFAERHCAAYGRLAHLRWTERRKAVFDCVWKLPDVKVRPRGSTGGIY